MMRSLQSCTIFLIIYGSLLRLGSSQQFFFQPPGNFRVVNGPIRQFPPRIQQSFNPTNPGNFRFINRPIPQFPPRIQQPFIGTGFPQFTNRFPAPNVAPVTSVLTQQRLLNFVNLLTVATAFRAAQNNNEASNNRVAANTPIGWSSWTPWTTCSRDECGFHERTRSCNGGNVCVGNNKETELCNEVTSCSFVGVWSEWGTWERCSPLCNGGLRKRTRKCSAGNFQCAGVSLDFQPCSSDNPNRFEFENRCYEVFNVALNTRFNHIQASEMCKATRGVLADIKSQAHQELLITEAKKTVTTSYIRHGFWLGMSVDASANVFLSSGQPAPYVDWAAGSDVSVTDACSCIPPTNLVLAISSDSTRDGLHALPDRAPRRGAICEYDP